MVPYQALSHLKLFLKHPLHLAFHRITLIASNLLLPLKPKVTYLNHPKNHKNIKKKKKKNPKTNLRMKNMEREKEYHSQILESKQQQTSILLICVGFF